MSNDDHKNPDYLLTLIKKDESRGKEGKFKIFLGMAAGVGKTFAMLQSARQLKTHGVDVAIGVVEHHGRKDTVSLLEGFEILPRKTLSHKSVTLKELDIDAILKRRPQLVLIDELAHTNAPGSRHAKRYLDVLEILKAGIDVFSTLNVQHIESRIDTVKEITHVDVGETIPDLVLDRADEIVLIDLPPEELIKRLSEGKIYADDSAILAAQNFFRRGNLTALREIALRIAAERVDRELREYKTLHGIDKVWKASGRLMVAVFASPYSEVLIRWTRRVADLLGVTWIGAYVEEDRDLTDEEKRLLEKNINLVQQTGGELVSTRDEDTVNGLLRIAHQNNVTQIIVGKSQRSMWENFWRGGSLASRLLQRSGHIDVYAVSTNRARARQGFRNSIIASGTWFRADDMGMLAVFALAAWALAAALVSFVGYLSIGYVFVLAVSVAGVFLSRGGVLLLALLYASIHDYFFIPPRFTFQISRPEDLMVVVTMFAAAAVIGHLTSRLSHKEKTLRSREDRVNLLYGLAKEIASAQSVEQVCLHAEDHLEKFLGVPVCLLVRIKSEGEKSLDFQGSPIDSQKEQAVALWTLKNGEISGYGTETLSAAEWTYMPIKGKSGVLGVGCIQTDKIGKRLTIDQLVLVDAFLNQIAAALEREVYHDRVKDLALVEQTQKLYKSLFDCISHELKTPLAAIKGSASAILDPISRTKEDAVVSLSGQILEASERLQRIVDNLLDMTRIESGFIRPKKELCDVGDLIATAIHEVNEARKNHDVKIFVASEISPILGDPVLIHQALANVLHNAFVYTPERSSVEITAKPVDSQFVEIIIRDHGPGLPKENPSIVLDKFYRADSSHSGGVGLGLSITKGFVEAMGGQVRARNHEKGGAEFSIRLGSGGLV